MTNTMSDQKKDVYSSNLNAPLSENALYQCWHPVARSSELTDKPVGIRLLDRPVVLWRSSHGVVAFYDLCMHRGTPLSLGWTENGRLVCAYHGWQYGADGACVRIPSIPPDRGIPAKARVVAYHATEKYGLIWVCLGQPVADIPEFPEEIHDSSYRWDAYSSQGQWKANAARMIENLLDFSHFAWVHPGILGDASNAECEATEITRVPGGFQFEIIGEIRVLLQVGETKWPGLENVPNALDLAKTPKAKRLLQVAIVGPNDINRLFTLPPGVPAERVKALQQAFGETFKDPEFKADVAKARLVLRPISVDKIKEIASSWLDMPQEDKKELQQILKIK